VIPTETWSEVIKNIEGGLTQKDSCDLAGIHVDSLMKRMRRDSIFSKRIKKANIEFKKTHVNKIAKDDAWQSSAWLLERKFKDEFGKLSDIDPQTLDLKEFAEVLKGNYSHE